MKSTTKSDDLPNGWGLTAIAGLVPFVLYAFTAGGHSFWLDSAEFTAAAVDLDIAHPPGHPLAALWGRTFALLPIGPLPYRVALAQGLAGAIAAGALQLSFARTLLALGVDNARSRGLLSLATSWLLAFSYGFWFQAVRAEVYALQTMLICLALERLVKLALDRELVDVRPLYAACFWLGLGLANHHFMSVLAAPALLHGLVRGLQKHRARCLGWSLASGTIGLVTYLYLPLRAAAEPAMDLGHPVTWKSFFWVVSAQVYARRIGAEAIQPLGERFADLLVILVEHFSAALLLALLGFYLLARKRELWPLAAVWSVTAVVTLCGRAWLNPVRGNPDVLGYMLPGFAGYLALALAALVLLLDVLGERFARAAQLVVGVVVLGLALAQLRTTYAQASLASLHATDDFDQLRQQPLPPRALLVLTQPETAFRHWEAEAVERARPDVDMLPLPFVNYAGRGDLLLRRQPALRALLTSYRRSPEEALEISPLLALAHTRPVLVEAEIRSCWQLFPRLVPEGLLYRVVERAPTRQELRDAAAARGKRMRELYRALADQLSGVETRRQVLWLHFMDALYFASHGEPELALGFVQQGLALQPKERELLLLKQVLQSGPERFSLRDFLPPG